MKLELTKEHSLVCPVCQTDYVQHQGGQVQVYERRGGIEDQESVLYTPNFAGASPGTGNPSPRRNAVVVPMVCEEGHSFVLDIIQHKGQTFVSLHVPEGV